MPDYENLSDLISVYVLVNYGLGSRVLEELKKLGLPGGTIVPAKGTVKNSFLNFLSVYSEDKEVVLIGTSQSQANLIIDTLDKCFQFSKPHHGIVFTIEAIRIRGTSRYLRENFSRQEEQDMAMQYQLITVIVERGRAEDVVSAAQKVGAPGGTILNGRGAGIHETTRLFHMAIEPEKEVVWLIVESQQIDAIIEAIDQAIELDKPGHGILLTQGITSIRGLHPQTSDLSSR